MTKTMIKLMIVDDHPVVRDGIAQLLADLPDIQIVFKASSGEEAIKIAKENAIDVILMDIKMPGIGGIQATHKILANNPNSKIIALSTFANEPFPSIMLKSGAKGYLTKKANLETMLQAIHSVMAGKTYLDSEVAQLLALKNLPGSTPSPFDTLSSRELSILMMVANGMDSQTIAEKLYISSKTVNTYRYRLFEKLNLKNDVELTLFSIQNNLLEQG